MVIEILFTIGGLMKIISQIIMVHRVGKITSSVIKRVGLSNLSYLEEVIKRLALRDTGVIFSAAVGWAGSGIAIFSGSTLVTGFLVQNLKPVIFIIWIWFQKLMQMSL